ncbi:MAG: hypothetical protein EU536_02075 [Promethearchaeota archaeon]|nr:MAG: hypothetical protein EU536_02075 [Candidatus Lokiarchaeota archaeon]
MTTLFELIRSFENLSHLENTSVRAIKFGFTNPENQKKIKIRKCILTTYPNTELIHKVVRDKYDLIISYRLPEIWDTHQIIDELYLKIKLLFDNRIYLYEIPDDFRKGRLAEIIAEVFNFKVTDLLRLRDETAPDAIVGHICEPATPDEPVRNLAFQLQEKLNISPLRYIGNEENQIQKICLIFGHPLSLYLLRQAKEKQIDTIICTDFNYAIERAAEELDLNIFEASYYIGSLGLLKLTQLLRMTHTDVEFEFDNSKPVFKPH